MNLIGKPLDPNDGASCEFELNEIVNVCIDDDVLYLWGNIPLVLSSVTSPELSAAQARITELETALQNLVNFDDKNYYQRVHITQEPEVMKQARAALKVKP